MVVSWCYLSFTIRMIGVRMIVLAVMLVVMTVLLLFTLYQYNKLWDSIYLLTKEIRESEHDRQ